MNEETGLTRSLNEDFLLELPEPAGREELQAGLAVFINDMLLHDFPRLINLLYRLDVSEKKLQQWLLENSLEDAGRTIADLVIERQLQKIASRKKYSSDNAGIDEEEKW